MSDTEAESSFAGLRSRRKPQTEEDSISDNKDVNNSTKRDTMEIEPKPDKFMVISDPIAREVARRLSEPFPEVTRSKKIKPPLTLIAGRVSDEVAARFDLACQHLIDETKQEALENALKMYLNDILRKSLKQ